MLRTQKGQTASLRSQARKMAPGFKPGQSHQRTSKKGCFRSAPALRRLTDDQSYKCNPRQIDEMPSPASLFSFFPALLLFFQSMFSLCWSHCLEIYLHFLHLKFRKLILRAGKNLCSSKWIRFYKHTQNSWKAHLILLIYYHFLWKCVFPIPLYFEKYQIHRK